MAAHAVTQPGVKAIALGDEEVALETDVGTL
jgi:hypothetical protein